MLKRTAEEWQQLFNAHQHSGQSAAAFCREHGLCAKYFSKRRQQLCHPAMGSPVPPSAFVPVTVTPPRESVRVELQLGNTLVVMLPSGLSPAWLADLILQLRP